MSRKYKFKTKDGSYFISFATVFWIDLFTREIYSQVLIDAIQFCQKEKGLVLFAWCIMPSHVHLIFKAAQENPSNLIALLKQYTSKKLKLCIEHGQQESRKAWLLWMMAEAAAGKTNVHGYQLWQHDNHPIEVYSPKVSLQKLNYLHNNPVVAGYVREPWHWKYSSAIDYAGGKGMLDVVLI